MDAKTVKCPQCGREVKVRENRFHDRIYSRHKMATAWDVHGGYVSGETRQDVQPGHNPYAAMTYEITCPMSGCAVDG